MARSENANLMTRTEIGARSLRPKLFAAGEVDPYFRNNFQLGAEETYVTEHSDNPQYRQRGATGSRRVIWVMSSPISKNIPVPASPKSNLYPSPSRLVRGAFRDRHGREAGCGGR